MCGDDPAQKVEEECGIVWSSRSMGLSDTGMQKTGNQLELTTIHIDLNILFDDKQQNKSGRKFYSSDSFFEFDLTFHFDRAPFRSSIRLIIGCHLVPSSPPPDHSAIILLGVSRALNGKHHNGHLDRTPFVGRGEALISPPFGVLQTINVRGRSRTESRGGM
ncbi:hypothetical protein CEXT_766671 [Caerostris extrusa]|uniref:Uncharacterized protein n=1 Tax=Caerostris extrusa TaxID=172846 RepID=A0AAV4WHX6_CAEEX|nr:hypothetical protein CEXT_766671 [Caerostris extrusa]